MRNRLPLRHRPSNQLFTKFYSTCAVMTRRGWNDIDSRHLSSYSMDTRSTRAKGAE